MRVRERRGGEQNSRRTSDEVLPENLAEGSQRIPPAKNHQRAGHGLTCCPLPLPSGVRRRSRGGNGRRDAGLNQFSPAARARHFRGRHGRERAGHRRRRACRTRCRGRRPYSGVRRRSGGQQRSWRRRAESIQPDSAPARQFDGRHGRARARPNPADPPVYAPGGGEHDGTPAGVEGDDLEPPCG